MRRSTLGARLTPRRSVRVHRRAQGAQRRAQQRERPPALARHGAQRGGGQRPEPLGRRRRFRRPRPRPATGARRARAAERGRQPARLVRGRSGRDAVRDGPHAHGRAVGAVAGPSAVPATPASAVLPGRGSTSAPCPTAGGRAAARERSLAPSVGDADQRLRGGAGRLQGPSVAEWLAMSAVVSFDMPI